MPLKEVSGVPGDAVTCHPEYTASNGILPTDTGAQVVADAIWSTMQQECVAQ